MKIKREMKISLTQMNVHPLVWILFVVYIVLSQVVTQLFNIEASRLSGMILIAPIALMLLVELITSGGKIGAKFSYYHIYILAFGLFCVMSSMWAQSSALSMSKGLDIIETLIIMMIISICFKDKGEIDQLLKGIMWAYYILIFYEIIFYGWGYFTQIMADSSRVSSEFINANTLGMCASFAIVINLYLIFSKKTALWTLALDVVCVFVIAASGSRKALVSLLLGVFMYFLIRSFRKNQRTLPFIRFLIAVPIIFIIVYQILQLPMFNGIMDRAGDMINIFTGGVQDRSVTIRMSLIHFGIELFREHPILGVGIDNPRLYTYNVVGDAYYLHNNFVEMLAAGGLLGTIIYYSIYVKLFFSYIKRRDFDDPQYCVCVTLLIITLILDYGMVSYYSKLTYIFLFLFVRYDEKLRQNRRVQKTY